MRRILLSACLTLASAFTGQTASAQCVGPNFGVFTQYGNTCAFFGFGSFLSGVYDPTTCTMSLTHTAAPTCCNVLLASNALLIGAQPIAPGIALPELLVPGCELNVAAFTSVSSSTPSSPMQTVWQFPVPASAIGLTLFFQGVNVYFTTIGMTTDIQTSNGLRAQFS